MHAETIWMLIFMFAFFISWIWGAYKSSQLRNLRSEFVNARLSMNKFMSMYVIVARQNRELVSRYNNFKKGVRDEFFLPFLDTQQVIDFYNRHDVPQGDAREDESNKDIVNKSVENGQDNLKAWGTNLS